ncbi:sodium:proton antiporter [Campylobacter mucosalis]|uniref:Putative phosphoribosyltransferase n=1 Tax=Campylobacter mucosalis CCUG 21559 TaxID=1032067 RepID=A0A6G5QIP6_9BACT|nr:phosphoribosyltransferase family protein [Campylobacter mucosalis]KEA45694.1 sodium:proton antiporter [Campylobacter mucosalis]QCD45531.1 putative phosphoribosyltransferase [Campylobacter mucosalis CCUG 21559]QKF63447.1 putative phosphoribosyltransferase [Campylobacter mucosalis]
MIENTIKFKNQLDAATKLFEILPKKELLDRKTLVICPSLESVIMADELCLRLGLNYEMLFCEPIPAPNNAECNIAVVSETEEIVLNDALIRAFGISYDFVYGEAHRKYEEKILKNIYKFRKGNLIGKEKLDDRNILLVDEGCETGLTALVCIKTLINLGAKTISYATPVIAQDVAVVLGEIVDEIYAVDKIVNFIDVDSYYEEKLETTTECIMSILEDSPKYLPLQKQQQGDEE